MVTLPQITVLMPVHNGEKYLREAIDSIINQTYTDFEFLIINDGSTDSSRDIILSSDDLRIRLVDNDENMGLTKSLNKGIRHAAGEYIARQDADDVSYPKRLEKQVRFLERNRDHAAVGSCIHIINKKSKIKGTLRKPLESDLISETLQKNNCIAHGSVLMRKNGLLEVGLYDESIDVAQDYDLFIRLSEKFKLANLPDILYGWRNRKGNISNERRQLQRLYNKIIQDRAWSRQHSRLNEGRMDLHNKDMMEVSSNPRFSVLMANYNNAEFMSEAIRSIVDQTFRNWELIIMDDCSTDNSIQVIKRFSTDKRIRLLENSSNIGYTKTLNKLVSKSRAPVFGIFDSDDVLTVDALEVMYRAHIENPNCGFLYSQFLYCDQQLNPVQEGFCRDIPPQSTNLKGYFSSAFRTFKKPVYSRTDGFNERFLYGQDRDIIFKMEEVTDIMFVDRVLYKHRILPKSHSNDPSKKKVGHLCHILAKYDAYQRRLNTEIPNLNRFEISTELFIGFLVSLRIKSFKEAALCISRCLSINPLILLTIWVYVFKRFLNKIEGKLYPDSSFQFPNIC